jgi:hypothetical protein
MMSGYDPEFGDSSHAGRNLAGWLQKPFSVTTLAVTLAEALQRDERST